MALFRAKYYKKRIKYYGTATPLSSSRSAILDNIMTIK